jgi:hypothetical protein
MAVVLLPSVDPRAAEIIKIMVDFEASVQTAEAALVARDWGQLDSLLSTQHRLTAALANALDETRDERPQAFTDEVNRRLRGISERRADQMRRLIAFNHLVKQRLSIISRTREMRRVNVASRTPARVLDLLQ